MNQTLVGVILSLISCACFAETWRRTAKIWDRETRDLLVDDHLKPRLWETAKQLLLNLITS